MVWVRPRDIYTSVAPETNLPHPPSPTDPKVRRNERQPTAYVTNGNGGDRLVGVVVQASKRERERERKRKKSHTPLRPRQFTGTVGRRPSNVHMYSTPHLIFPTTTTHIHIPLPTFPLELTSGCPILPSSRRRLKSAGKKKRQNCRSYVCNVQCIEPVPLLPCRNQTMKRRGGIQAIVQTLVLGRMGGWMDERIFEWVGGVHRWIPE